MLLVWINKRKDRMMIYVDNKEITWKDFQELGQELSIDYLDCRRIVEHELFKPFQAFTEILQEISGFGFPSGFAFISDNSIIENMYIGQAEEATIDLDIENYKRVLIINNYAGPEGGEWIWKSLTQADLERAFSIKFNKKIIEAIGGWSSTVRFYNPA